MAHSLSAKKRIRQNVKRRSENRSRKGAVRTQIKKFEKIMLHPSDVDGLEQEFRRTQKLLDKLVARGSIHRNAAARKKSRLAHRLAEARQKIH